ncbi:AN1-type zinc finger protein 2A-like isoform X1 [Crassostrea virginica]|uniref:AN1-type zinc finger protein 2A-like isoform X1 n=1 Tax=Crassostrea virginica TaxID=6565 RepID=A0A8B8DGE2_CRAVI|nr:AN1-type zinc finger protein 2A-like isoform X1 [Crassostrea virginica]
MEFPDLGQNCHEKNCKQLDFLPMKCDACSQIFCRDHIHYNTHSCPESYKKDNQVPVCPLCNNPIPVKKGEMPDDVVGQHIDRDCQSDPARNRRKVYTNRCSSKGCKQKELIPVLCESCHQNFCLKHRHETDHDCKGFQATGRGVSRAGAAAIFRNPQSSNKPTTSGTSRPPTKPQITPLSQLGRELDSERRLRQAQAAQSVQGRMTEDEALAQAIQMSMAESSQPQTQPSKPLTQQEQEDLLLAQAIAASQEENRREQRRRQEAAQRREENKTSCQLS